MRELRHWLVTRRGEIRQRLRALLQAAPGQGICSLGFDLGPSGPAGADLSPPPLPDREMVYWAQPAQGLWRLALGHALTVESAGPARFSALQAAFTGLAPHWLHDDTDAAGAAPLAHLGFAFDEESRESLPNARLVVPALLLESRAGRRHLTLSCATRDGENAVGRWEEIAGAVGSPQAGATAPGEAAALLERAYLARVRAALAAIGERGLEKVVLARSSLYEADRPIGIPALLKTLERRHPGCTIFAVGHATGCFAGATPERLVRLKDGEAQADALAGTAWLGNSRRPGALALQGDKNSREQQLVVDAVRAALAPLCTALDGPGAAEVLQLRELQHLRSRIGGVLHPGVGLFDLVAALHPTPAVGGSPARAAGRWLASHGERRPAWYTGGMGWIDRRGNGEVAVPLRCAEISGRHARLFAGAGIVAGSDPAQELAETEAKFGTMRQALAEASGQHFGMESSKGRRAETGAAARTGTQ